MPRERPRDLECALALERAQVLLGGVSPERNPMRSAISARVGGKPDTSVSSLMSCRISDWRSVSGFGHAASALFH
jgi:hypothetical protein